MPNSESAWDSVDYLLDDWARERPDLDFAPVGVVTRMGRVREHLARNLAKVFAGHGLTPADFRVLVNLRRVGKPYVLPQARLMEALDLTSGSVSLRLQRLVERGIVTREPDPNDRRGSHIRLTEEGLRLFDVLAPEHLANEDRLLSALTDEQRHTLADLLRHLLVSFERPQSTTADALGLVLEPAARARARRAVVGLSDAPGLLVAQVDSGPAQLAGVVRGDLIVAIDGEPTHSTVTFARLLDEMPGGKAVELTVLRGDKRLTLRLPPRRSGPGPKQTEAPVRAKASAQRKVNPQQRQRLK